MEHQLADQLAHLDQGQVEIIRRQERMERQLDDVQRAQRNIILEIGGVPDELDRATAPDRRSLRWRVHTLESNRAAAEAATAAVSAAKQLRDSAAEKRFTKTEKVIGLALAFLLLVSTYVAPILAARP